MIGQIPTVRVGLQCKLYYTNTTTRLTWSASSSNGIFMGPAPQTLALMNIVRNVNLTNTAGDADGSSRASQYKLHLQALFDAGLECDIPWNPSDPAFIAMEQAYFGRGTIALAALDGDIAVSGSQGLWADYIVAEFPRDEPLDKEVMSKVKFMPCPSLVPPEWVSVTS